jgi:RNA polymerase sigma-70 factor (ECF subfamily)
MARALRVRGRLPARVPALYPAIAEATHRLRGFALKLTRDRDEADELLQCTALRAIEYSGTFAPGTNLGAWLHVILRHLWLTERNRPYRRRRADVDWRALEIAIDGGQEAYVRLHEAERAIAALPRGMRRAIAQARDGLAMAECAARAGIALGTAKSRLSRARAALAAAGV